MTVDEAKTAYREALRRAAALWHDLQEAEAECNDRRALHRQALDQSTMAERAFLDAVLAEAKADL